MSTQLLSCDFTHFPNLKNILDKHSDQGNEEYDPSVHMEVLPTLAECFENCFSSLSDLKPFSLLSNPFKFDLSKSGKVCQRLRIDKKSEKELLYIHVLDEDEINQLKRKGIQELWMNNPKPVLQHCTAKLMSTLGSIYTCEQTFSAMDTSNARSAID